MKQAGAYNRCMALNAIITAGGGVPRSLAAYTGVSRKALIDAGGRSLLDTAVDAVQSSTLISEGVVVGNEDVRRALGGRMEFLAEGATLVENIQRGFMHFKGELSDYITISPDLPFLTGAALDVFLRAARPACQIGVPLIDREDFLACYPGAPNAFSRIAGGRQVTTGSCFYLHGPSLKANFPLFHDLFRFRKFPHRLAVMLGLPVIFAFAFGRLRVEAAEQRAAALTGAQVRAIGMSDASIAYDIDNAENYEFALELMARRG